MATQSGIFNLPSILPHPKPLTDTSLVSGMLCYAIQRYENIGISCLVTHYNGNVSISMGDWDGNAIDLKNNDNVMLPIAIDFLKNKVQHLVAISNAAGVKQALYYFAVDTGIPTLVDIQLSLNKFLGPGMIRDIFGKTFDTQKILKIDVMTDVLLEQMLSGSGNYCDGVILKPSRYRYVGDALLSPLYIEIPKH